MNKPEPFTAAQMCELGLLIPRQNQHDDLVQKLSEVQNYLKQPTPQVGVSTSTRPPESE